MPHILDFDHIALGNMTANIVPPPFTTFKMNFVSLSIDFTRVTAVEGAWALFGSNGGPLLELPIDSDMLSVLTFMTLTNGRLVISLPAGTGANGTGMILLRDPPAVISLNYTATALGDATGASVKAGAWS